MVSALTLPCGGVHHKNPRRQDLCTVCSATIERVVGTRAGRRVVKLTRNSRKASRVSRLAAEQRITEQTELLEYAKSYSKKISMEVGEVEIRLLQSEDIDGASVCLIRGFAGTPEEVPFSAARSHFTSIIKDIPDAILLVATIIPKDKALLPEGKTERLVGTVSLSFTNSTRAKFETLQPFSDSAYMYNMAIDKDFRRQGIARGMLEACEEFCRLRGAGQMQLHVRLADIPAMELYKSSGFEEQDRDLFLVEFKGYRPRALLYKRM